MKFKKYFSLIEFLFPLKDRRLILIGMLFLFLPTLTLAADFISLVGIPGVPDNGQDLNQYFNAIYRLSISLAALLAVVRIVLAGAKYMLTDIVPAKGEALEDIKGALLGLLIILGAVLILSTINYDLTHYNIKFDAVEPPPPPPPSQEVHDRQYYSEFCNNLTAISDSCNSIPCESSILGINAFAPLPGETNLQACQRTCSALGDDSFVYNDGDINLNQNNPICAYSVDGAQTCDRDSGVMCCENIKDGNWNFDFNVCADEHRELSSYCGFSETNVDGRGVVITDRTMGAISFYSDCSAQIANCTSNNGSVIQMDRNRIAGAERIMCDTSDADFQNEIIACNANYETIWNSLINHCEQNINIERDINIGDVDYFDSNSRPLNVSNMSNRPGFVFVNYTDGAHESVFLECSSLTPQIDGC